MRKWIFILGFCITAVSCGKKSEETTNLTPAQELESVDSATIVTNARIDSLSKSVDDIQREVDSLLNENK